jgi:hypothetical protein
MPETEGTMLELADITPVDRTAMEGFEIRCVDTRCAALPEVADGCCNFLVLMLDDVGKAVDMEI